MPRVNLADFIERTYADATTVIELPDGSDPIKIPSPDQWPDDAFAAARAGDVRTCLVLTLGEAEYARAEKAGANWRVINAIVSEQQGLEVPNSQASPKSSGTTATPLSTTSSKSASTSRKN